MYPQKCSWCGQWSHRREFNYNTALIFQIHFCLGASTENFYIHLWPTQYFVKNPFFNFIRFWSKPNKILWFAMDLIKMKKQNVTWTQAGRLYENRRPWIINVMFAHGSCFSRRFPICQFIWTYRKLSSKFVFT